MHILCAQLSVSVCAHGDRCGVSIHHLACVLCMCMLVCVCVCLIWVSVCVEVQVGDVSGVGWGGGGLCLLLMNSYSGEGGLRTAICSILTSSLSFQGMRKSMFQP